MVETDVLLLISVHKHEWISRLNKMKKESVYFGLVTD